MRSLERNKIPFWFATYSDKIPVLDEFGQETGQYTSYYSKPVKTRQRVSPNKGNSTEEAFGLMADYDRVIVTTDNLELTETSVLWLDSIPQLDSDGDLAKNENNDFITPHDYKVVRCAKDINVSQYAIKRVTN